MIYPKKRVLILVGHYGTGKTTIALNIASQWVEEKKQPIALADLDVNNPYFRSRDWLKHLEEKQVEVIMPDREIAYAEMPFLPKEIYSIIHDQTKQIVIDVGGHEVGTNVLGSLSEQIMKTSYETWMIINTYRPEMNTKDEIRNLYKRLQALSKLKIHGLINNTNLSTMTTIDDLIESEKIVIEAAKDLDVSYLGTTVDEDLFGEEKKNLISPIPIKKFDLLKW